MIDGYGVVIEIEGREIPEVVPEPEEPSEVLVLPVPFAAVDDLNVIGHDHRYRLPVWDRQLSAWVLQVFSYIHTVSPQKKG